MQVNTIRKIIEKKLEDWLSSIKDEPLRLLVRDNILVSGGAITTMLLDQPVNDFDVYIKSIDVLKKLSQYYTAPFKSITILDGRFMTDLVNDYESNYGTGSLETDVNKYAISLRNLKDNQLKLIFESDEGGYRIEKESFSNYEPKYFSPNAISLSDDLQIVLRFWGDSTAIHETFDFVHATNYFTFEEGVVLNAKALESILTKQLFYQGSHYPVTSIIRMKKFLKRGFNINAGEMLKIMFQISKLDLTNPDVLEEQLIGVDVAYFDLLITTLRAKQSKDPNFKLNPDYLSKLIDKIFN